MKSLRNKVVVITGASSGFGRGAALKFAKEGANLVLGARRIRLLNELRDECEREGVRAIALEADVSRCEDIEELASRAVEEFGHFDVWVNNAGVAAYGEFDRVPIDEHEQVVRTNLFGTLHGSHAAIRHFRQRRDGVLINVGSYLSKGSAPYQASYVVSKHAIRGLGTALRQELEADRIRGIHVCTVMPTSHDTPFFGHAANYTGKLVRPISPVYDPRQVIDTIVELAVHPQDEVMVGSSAKVASAAGKVMPSVLERRKGKKVRKEQIKQKETAPESSGSIFQPIDSEAGIRGGWRRVGAVRKVLKTAILGLPLAVGALAFRRRRHAPYRRAA